MCRRWLFNKSNLLLRGWRVQGVGTTLLDALFSGQSQSRFSKQ